MVKLYQTWLVALFAMLCALSAHAVSPFDPLTTAVSFTDVSAALFVVAAAIVGVLVIIKGIKWIYRMLGGH